MNYKECLEYIEEISTRGSVLGLGNMQALMHALGDPQDELKFLHVAGTNGKGSTSAFIASGLIESGYKVGIYSSPSVFTYLEKIKLGRKNISQKDFAAVLTKVRAAAETAAIPATVFEVETAAAFCYFNQQGCNLVVLECGMGGDMDATNIVKTTVLSVITHIDMDHAAFLGKTLAQIAEKKAGIIKQGVPVVTVQQYPEVEAVLRNIAGEKGAPFYLAEDETLVHIKKAKLSETVYTSKAYGEIRLLLPGRVQIMNSLLAIKAFYILSENFDRITEKTIKRGISKAKNPGRLELIYNKPQRPQIVIDGAHNPDAARRLLESIELYMKGKRIIYIMGVFHDKDYEEMLQILAPRAAHIITVATPLNERALPAFELAKAALCYNANVTEAASVEEALEEALLFAEKNDIILSFGSLSYLGRLKALVEKMNV